MGNGPERAGLGEVRFHRGGCLLVLLGVNSILLIEPATQVDQFAALAAERKLGPVLGALPFHYSVADRAGRLYHRSPTPWNWAIFPPPTSFPPPRGCRRRRSCHRCRWYRSCRRPPGRPWPP